jgi:hypothetical protein
MLSCFFDQAGYGLKVICVLFLTQGFKYCMYHHFCCPLHAVSMPVWCFECALQGRWSSSVLILSRSWWVKPFGNKTCGETSGSTACGWFIRQYGTLPLFCQDFPYHWYVVQFWIHFPGHLKLLFSMKWLQFSDSVVFHLIAVSVDENIYNNYQ